jgi:hypothetical protein
MMVEIMDRYTRALSRHRDGCRLSRHSSAASAAASRSYWPVSL